MAWHDCSLLDKRDEARPAYAVWREYLASVGLGAINACPNGGFSRPSARKGGPAGSGR